MVGSQPHSGRLAYLIQGGFRGLRPRTPVNLLVSLIVSSPVKLNTPTSLTDMILS